MDFSFVLTRRVGTLL